ncbi:MAG: hypothetical protein R3266_09805 [Gemmatimonadota bacterium]|nr:hypothetical protein [Gemmatimonadota bacterium]
MPTAVRSAAVCEVCGSPDRLGVGSCVACARSGSDTFVFLESPGRGADREVLEAWLVGALDGAVSRSEARLAVEGSRPVIALPVIAATRAVRALGLRGVSAVAVTSERAWKRIPAPLVLLAGVAGGVGLFVGAAGIPALMALGPAFSLLLVLSAARRLRVPIWEPETASILGLPSEAEAEVRAALQRLDPGRARKALWDMARLTSNLTSDEPFPPADEMLEASAELLRLSSRAAIDLDRLDRHLAVLEGDPATPAPAPAAKEALARAREAREAIATRLDEAVATLGRAGTASPDASVEVLGAAERLAAEADRRTAAWNEVERLTG